MTNKIPCTYKIVGNTIEIIPNEVLEDGAEYKVNINQLLKDIYNKNLPEDISYSFKTKDIEKTKYKICYEDKSLEEKANYNLIYSQTNKQKNIINIPIEYSIINGTTNVGNYLISFEEAFFEENLNFKKSTFVNTKTS